MRISDFKIMTKVDDSFLRVYAIAPYMRGEFPDPCEREHIDKKVREKFPNAHFVEVERESRPIAKDLGEEALPMAENWVFEWIVADDNQERKEKMTDHIEDEPDFPPTQAPRIWEIRDEKTLSAERNALNEATQSEVQDNSNLSSSQAQELYDLAAEMIRFGNRHWMHDEGQNVRMFGERIQKILKITNP